MKMNDGSEKSSQDYSDRAGESLVDLLRKCPIDDETWNYILDRPTDPPRDISFDGSRFEDGDEAAAN